MKTGFGSLCLSPSSSYRNFMNIFTWLDLFLFLPFISFHFISIGRYIDAALLLIRIVHSLLFTIDNFKWDSMHTRHTHCVKKWKISRFTDLFLSNSGFYFNFNLSILFTIYLVSCEAKRTICLKIQSALCVCVLHWMATKSKLISKSIQFPG